MQVRIDIPSDLHNALQSSWGDVSTAAKEALAIESYRTGRISLGMMAEFLGMGVLEADEWLARRAVPIPITEEDFEADRRDLASIFPEMR